MASVRIKTWLILVGVAGIGPRGTAAQTVRGHLLEADSRRAVVGGIVSLIDTTSALAAMTTTDEAGAFELLTDPGSYFIAAHATGYREAVDGLIDLGPGGHIEIEFSLRPTPIQLPGLTATVERTRAERYLDQQGFYERQERGFGSFIGPEELEARPPADTRDLLRRVPGIDVLDLGFAGEAVRCMSRRSATMVDHPRVYIDGVLVGWERHPVTRRREVDLGHLAIDDFAAVEVFTRASQIPIRFGGVGVPCVILIWTKGHG